MFTGLIEATGSIVDLEQAAGGLRVTIATSIAGELSAGDSIAVNGVCLTVVAPDQATVRADVSPETARVTTLGAVRPGAVVNLERPLRADGRLGGHFVQGHVDDIAHIEAVEPEGASHRVRIAYPARLAAYIVHKGSVAIDGVSLTVAALDEETFDVQIIPHTWVHTNLKTRRARDAVNLECDVLAKYVARALGRS